MQNPSKRQNRYLKQYYSVGKISSIIGLKINELNNIFQILLHKTKSFIRRSDMYEYVGK